jgi:hypothetical protein
MRILVVEDDTALRERLKRRRWTGALTTGCFRPEAAE